MSTRKIILAFAGTAVTSWSPSVPILIAGRSIVGSSIGLIATVVPLFISESAPADLRGQLSTLPQLMGIAAMILSYAMVFQISLEIIPSWRLMLGVA